MGQGIWIDSDKIGPDDSVAEILKHGTLSIGFIGLAETLKALTGKHHGESEESRKLGLEIITHMRKFCDNKSKETHLNFTLLATPAEGLSGRFVRIEQEEIRHNPRRYGQRLLHQLIPRSRIPSDKRIRKTRHRGTVSRAYERRTHQLR